MILKPSRQIATESGSESKNIWRSGLLEEPGVLEGVDTSATEIMLHITPCWTHHLLATLKCSSTLTSQTARPGIGPFQQVPESWYGILDAVVAVEIEVPKLF